MKQPSNPFFKIGNIIDDKWVIVEMIGKGGMAEVYRAHQLNLKRDVAIKIVSEEMLQNFEDDAEEIETAFGRFQREVQAMAQVRHKNILQVFDYGIIKLQKDNQDRPVEYIVMEYIPGDTFRYTMSEEGFDEESELIKAWLEKYFIPLLDGVEVIHNHDIIHRDLKPENILMDGDVPKIADFGLARSFRMKAVSNSWDVKGTLAYMAPEQFTDFRKVGKAADVYALGKILYEAIDGKIVSKGPPFKSVQLENPTSSFLKYMDIIIQTATAEAIESRFQTIDDFRKNILKALEILRSNKRTQDMFILNNQKWIWAGIIFAVFSVFGMAVWHLLGQPGKTIQKMEIIEKEKSVGLPENKLISDKQAAEESFETPNTLLGKDGIPMILINKNKIMLSLKNSPNQGLLDFQASPFYIDKIKVTVYNFTEFLNEVQNELTIENGIVKKGNEIWLYLGAGNDPSEQIIFKHNRFHLKNPEQGGLPIVRVTFYGAMAYAKHYGKRLLTEDEWRVVAGMYDSRINNKTVKTSNTQSSSRPHDQMMNLNTENIDPTIEKKDGNIKLRDEPDKMSLPVDMDIKIKEWVIPSIPSKKDKADTFDNKAKTISSAIGYSSGDSKLNASLRYPWEGFSDVGFRTAVDLENIKHRE